MPAAVYYSNLIAPKDSAVQAQALFGGVAMGVGRIIGNLLGGVIIDGAGLKAMLIFSAAFVFFGLILMQFSSYKYKTATNKTINWFGLEIKNINFFKI